jgi:hypothetical protein
LPKTIIGLKKETETQIPCANKETKKHKKRASYSYRTAQPSAFAAFRPWRNGQELIVKDLLFVAKVLILCCKNQRKVDEISPRLEFRILAYTIGCSLF